MEGSFWENLENKLKRRGPKYSKVNPRPKDIHHVMSICEKMVSICPATK